MNSQLQESTSRLSKYSEIKDFQEKEDVKERMKSKQVIDDGFNNLVMRTVQQGMFITGGANIDPNNLHTEKFKPFVFKYPHIVNNKRQ